VVGKANRWLVPDLPAGLPSSQAKVNILVIKKEIAI
jgi:hypothetical protein